MPPPDSTLDDRAVSDRELDAESARWLRALGAAGVERDQAAGRLHEMQLRIARDEVHRLPGLKCSPATSRAAPACVQPLDLAQVRAHSAACNRLDGRRLPGGRGY